jgi:hypothetical protein
MHSMVGIPGRFAKGIAHVSTKPRQAVNGRLIASFVREQAPAETIGPLIYHDVTDSPFDLSRVGSGFFLEDFSHGIELIPRDPTSPSRSDRIVKFSHTNGDRRRLSIWANDPRTSHPSSVRFWLGCVAVQFIAHQSAPP